MVHELFWRYTFYASLSVFTLWALLKTIGVIQTPLWLEFGIPAASIALGILAFFKDIIRLFNQIEERFYKMDVRFSVLETNVDLRFEHVNHNILRIDGDLKELRSFVAKH